MKQTYIIGNFTSRKSNPFRAVINGLAIVGWSIGTIFLIAMTFPPVQWWLERVILLRK